MISNDSKERRAVLKFVRGIVRGIFMFSLLIWMISNDSKERRVFLKFVRAIVRGIFKYSLLICNV
jgi:hypothetical protein